VRRKRPDWVYRANSEQSISPFLTTDGLGTYEPFIDSLTAGQETSMAKVLYDSQSYLRSMGRVTGTSFSSLGGAGRASGRKATIHAVRGFINVQPTTWALGQVAALRWRILAGEQLMDSGAIILDVAYTAWSNVAGLGLTPAYFRNQSRCLAEGTLMKAFGTSNDATMWNFPVRWRGRWSLREEDALFLYLEGAETAVNARVQFWCSTLVSDEG